MFVKPHETAPSSQLHGPPSSRGGGWAGVCVTIVAHALVAGSAYLANHLTNNAPPPRSYTEEHIVEARLVQLGKPPKKNALPTRKVPRKATAPEDSVAVTKKEEQKPPPRKKEKPKKPPQPTEEDLLQRLGDRAQALAEIAEEQEREGDPDGDPDGTEREAQLGDRYAGQLTSFFKRGWTIPSTLGDTSHLVTVANVEITRDLHVGDISIVERSGEPLFDQSVEDRLTELRNLQTTLPEPPLEVASRFLGQVITIRFTDRGR